MKKIVTILFTLLLTGSVFSQALDSQVQRTKYSEVKIHLTANHSLNNLADAGFTLGHARQVESNVFQTVINDRELDILKSAGVQVDVLIDDMSAWYREKPTMTAAERAEVESNASVQGFGYGSMGGFYTLAEVEAELDNMFATYPNLVTQKVSLGQTWQDRSIWMVKISDNPNQDEDEAEALYTALHHAREPAGMMSVIYYMYHLLENYGTDPEVTWLVDNREMYFVPVVNPDGYRYNQTTDPNGGGYHRKNRRNTQYNPKGVDLNRNYGDHWGYDNNGSSPSEWSETYRGPSAFSEPETKAMRDFCNSREFTMALNYHTYSNLLIYPYGYTNLYSPDHTTFQKYAIDMTQFNNYVYGNADETVGYNANGDSDDWMYGEQNTKGKILAYTPEVGSSFDGFWPSQSRIFPLAEENLYPNLRLAHYAGGVVETGATNVTDQTNDGTFNSGENGTATIDLSNIGQGTAGNVAIRLVSTSAYFSTGADQNVAISAGGTNNAAITFNIDASTPDGHIMDLAIEIVHGGKTQTVALNNIEVVGGALPVELISFTGIAQKDGSFDLSWSTASEVQLSHFEIEHKTESTNWTKLDQVSAGRENYTFTTDAFAVNNHQFRLRNVNIDGTSTWSETLTIESVLPITLVLSNAYPNPFTGVTTFGITVPKTQLVNLTVYDVVGHKVMDILSETLTAGVAHNIKLDANNLPAGVYFVRAESDSSIKIKKIVVLK